MKYFRGRNDDRVSEFAAGVNKPSSGDNSAGSSRKSQALSSNSGNGKMDTPSGGWGPLLEGKDGVGPVCDETAGDPRPRTITSIQGRFLSKNPEFKDIRDQAGVGDWITAKFTRDV